MTHHPVPLYPHRILRTRLAARVNPTRYYSEYVISMQGVSGLVYRHEIQPALKKTQILLLYSGRELPNAYIRHLCAQYGADARQQPACY
jgi:hypothetical protein